MNLTDLIVLPSLTDKYPLIFVKDADGKITPATPEQYRDLYYDTVTGKSRGPAEIITERLLDLAPKPSPFAKQFTLPVTTAEGAVILQPGLTIVSGPTASGKTTFMMAVMPAWGEEVAYALAVEPYERPENIGSIRAFRSADRAIVHLFAECYNHGIVGMLDSLRHPLFNIAGAAGDKGIIMAFFTAITNLSNALADHGVTMLATVNPMTRDPSVSANFLSFLSAAVPCYVSVDNVSYADGALQSISGHLEMRPRRVPVPMRLTPGLKGRRMTPETVSLPSETRGSIARGDSLRDLLASIEE